MDPENHGGKCGSVWVVWNCGIISITFILSKHNFIVFNWKNRLENLIDYISSLGLFSWGHFRLFHKDQNRIPVPPFWVEYKIANFVPLTGLDWTSFVDYFQWWRAFSSFSQMRDLEGVHVPSFCVGLKIANLSRWYQRTRRFVVFEGHLRLLHI